LKKPTSAFPSKELTNNLMHVSLSFAPMLWHAFEKENKCSLTKMVPLPENLGKWSLNFRRGLVTRVRSKGKNTCHGVVFAYS